LKHLLAQFVLLLSLLCNPVAGLFASVPDMVGTEGSALGQMPCQTDLLHSQLVDQGTDIDRACPFDCCNDDDCSMDQACQNCLNPHFANAILLETLDIYFFFAAQKKLELTVDSWSGCSILPEIRPPDALYLS
jgi:hypothetical protein